MYAYICKYSEDFIMQFVRSNCIVAVNQNISITINLQPGNNIYYSFWISSNYVYT